MVLLFIGPSGSGKDTQAEILAQKHGFDVISTGDLLRAEMKSGSELGKETQGYIDQGKWAPDDITYQSLENYLQKNKSENIILTGAVRRASQIPLLEKALENQGLTLDRVIFFDLNDEEVVDRLSGRRYSPDGKRMYHIKYKPPEVEGKDDETGEELIQRHDDTPEAIRSRLQEFHDTTNPILEGYERQGILMKIDASPNIESIAENLEPRLKLR